MPYSGRPHGWTATALLRQGNFTLKVLVRGGSGLLPLSFHVAATARDNVCTEQALPSRCGVSLVRHGGLSVTIGEFSPPLDGSPIAANIKTNINVPCGKRGVRAGDAPWFSSPRDGAPGSSPSPKMLRWSML